MTENQRLYIFIGSVICGIISHGFIWPLTIKLLNKLEARLVKSLTKGENHDSNKA